MNIGDMVKVRSGFDAGRIGTIVSFDFFEDDIPKAAEVKFPFNRILISTSKLEVVESKSFRWRN